MVPRPAAIRYGLVLVLLVGALSCSDSAVAPNDAGIVAKQAPPAVLNYDERLDMADAAIEKASVLLLESQSPSAKNPERPFGGHRDRAVDLLEKAREEIQAARVYVSDPKHQQDAP